MEQVDVLAVVGSCAPERLRYAKRLAAMTQRMFVPARRLAMSPDPVAEAVALAPWSDRPAGAVLEMPATTSMTELIGALAEDDAPTRLTGVVCVVDAGHLLDDLHHDGYIAPAMHRQHPLMRQHTARAMLTVTQLEYASLIVLVNWTALSTADLSTTMALVSHLSPGARLQLHREVVEPWPVGEPYAVDQERPGWVRVLNGDFAPLMTDARVSALRYEQIRPLHPARVQRLLDERIEPGEFGTVIRSSGFCRLATRPGLVGRWDHVGRMISFEPVGRDDALGDGDELLALGQDLAFIGLDLDHAALTAALDDAALDDQELTVGPGAWTGLPDPFPAWHDAGDRTE